MCVELQTVRHVWERAEQSGRLYPRQKVNDRNTIVSVRDESPVMLDLMTLLLLYQQEEATGDLWKVDRVHVQRGSQGLRSA